jgi:hypothetical protein
MRRYCKRIKNRITKYNPNYRDSLGGYMEDDWTSISDIGKTYNNRLFTFDDYEKMETLYVDAVCLILKYFGSKHIKVEHIFKMDKKKDFNKFNDLKLFGTYKKTEAGSIIKDKKEIAELIRLKLREHIAELELRISGKNRTEILFGFDYYMYLKTNANVNLLFEEIKKIGLFIE